MQIHKTSMICDRRQAWMRIALATYKEPAGPCDQALATALRELRHDAQSAVWSDATRDWREFDAVVIRSCWDYHLHVEQFLGWIASLERDGVAVINSPDLIRWNSRKTYLKELESAGITIPDSVVVAERAEENLGKICAARGWQMAVVKPIISASAHRTERRNSGSVRGPALVQEYIAAIETDGEYSLTFIDHEYSHAVNKKPLANDFRVQEEHGGTIVAAEPPHGAQAFAENVLSKMPHRYTYARVDIVNDRGQFRLMELEVIEPELYLHLAPGSAHKLAAAILEKLEKAGSAAQR
jgi:glutathione synthase/RimK-type ligase-like ATP-grasp enzyme